MALFLFMGDQCELVFDVVFLLGSQLRRHELPPKKPTPPVAAPNVASTSSDLATTQGDVLIVGGVTTYNTQAVLEFYNPVSQKFKNTGYSGGPSGFTALEIFSGPHPGQILVAGGANGTATISTTGLMTFKVSVPRSAQLYNFSSHVLSETGSLNDGRLLDTATLLPNGKVLIAGGFDKSGNPLASTELYDPSTGKFSLAASMTMRRAMHTATLLDDGTVLLAGGVNDAQGDIFGNAEIYDPTTGTFTATPGQMPQGDGVAGHTATLLATGNVLIAGGFNAFVSGGVVSAIYTTVNTALLYDPTSKQFTTTGNLIDYPAMHSATLLANGTVLIAGGYSGQAFWDLNGKVQGADQSGVLDSAEVYNPATGTFTCIGGVKNNACAASMVNARAGHSATIFASLGAATVAASSPTTLSGKVLLAGGVRAKASTVNTKNPPEALATAELFDPVNLKFTATGKMNSPHAFHSAVIILPLTEF